MSEIFTAFSAPEGPTGLERYEADPVRSLDSLRNQGVEIRKQEEAKRIQLEEHSASVLTGVASAFRFDTGTGVAGTKLHDYAVYKQDSTFNVAEAIKIDNWEFPENREWEQGVLKTAKSEAHYEVLKERVRDRREYLLNMEDMGVLPSMGLQLVAELGNIPNYFTFGLGGLAKASKLKRFFVAGSVTAAANTSEEAFINSMYNDKTVTDYIAAGALGMGLGWLGTFGGSAQRAKHIDDVGNNFANVHMKDSVDERVADFKGETDGKSTVGAQQINTIHKTFDPDFDPELKTPRMDEDNPVVQAAFAEFLSGNLPKADKLIHEHIALTSMAQSLHSSENVIARHMVAELLEHPEGVGRYNKHTAALEADLDFQRFVATYSPEYIRLKSAWNVLAEQNPAVKHKFDEAASVWIEASDVDAPSWAKNSSSVEGATEQMDDILKEYHSLYNDMNAQTYKIMQESGVLEASGDMDVDHLGRVWDGEKFHTLRNQYGDDALVETLQESILEGNDFRSAHAKADEEFANEVKLQEEAFEFKRTRAQEEVDAAKTKAEQYTDDVSTAGQRAWAKLERAKAKLDRVLADKPKVVKKPPEVEATAKRMAQALYNRFLNRATVSTADANLLSSANRALLMDALSDLKLDAPDMIHIKRILDNAGKDHMAQPFKHQMGMKIGHIHKSGVRVLDFMHTDLGSAYSSKQRYWLGRSAGARHGFDSEDAFQRGIDQLKRHGSDRGQDIKSIDADVARLEGGWKLIMGKPIEDMSAPGQVGMRVVRKAMATSSLGKLGIVQAGETGRVMSAVGITNIIDTIPAIKTMIMDVKDGRLDTPALLDIQEYVFGEIGAEHFMNHPDFRVDDFGHRVTNAERQLDRMSFWMSKASGWQLVHKAQRRFLMNGLAQKWYREFSEGTMSLAQMKDLGVPLEHYDGIKRMMKTHAEPLGHDGPFVTKAEGVNLHLGKWEPELRRTFALMLHRKGNNAVQDIIAGETPLWMNHGIGKFIGQFRTFSVAALGKQTVHDWRMHKEGDPEAALAFQFMLATSTMAVTARMAFDAAALPPGERAAYLKKNMNVRGVTKRVLNYHGQASPLVDAVEFLGSSFMPNTWGEVTGHSQYRNGRGLTSKIPGISYMNKAAKGISGVAKSVMPGETMSKSDWKAFVGVLPLSSWYGFHVLNKSFAEPILFNE